MLIPDFQGNLATRMAQLNTITQESESLFVVGSSFGGLMATIFATEQPHKVKELILLAPALNFPDFTPISKSIGIKTTIFQGRHDTVCPHDEIRAIAKNIFTHLTFNSVDDDHLLKSSFRSIPWENHLS